MELYSKVAFRVVIGSPQLTAGFENKIISTYMSIHGLSYSYTIAMSDLVLHERRAFKPRDEAEWFKCTLLLCVYALIILYGAPFILAYG